MGQGQGKANKVNVKGSCQMAVSRMNIHKGKKQNEIAKKKQEIANLLKNGNEELAKIKVESVIRDENTVMVYDIISQMVEVCQERTDFLINKKMEIPSDMWPHLQTIYYASPRLDIPELNKFCQLMNQRCKDLGSQLVNVTVKEKLELCLFDDEIKTVKLREIAAQFNVEYVPKEDPFKALRVDPLPPPSVPQQQGQYIPPQNQQGIVIQSNQNEFQINFQTNDPNMQMQGYPQPGMQQGMPQPGLQQYPTIPQNDPNQQQFQGNYPSVPSGGFQQPNYQNPGPPGPPGKPPSPM